MIGNNELKHEKISASLKEILKQTLHLLNNEPRVKTSCKNNIIKRQLKSVVSIRILGNREKNR